MSDRVGVDCLKLRSLFVNCQTVLQYTTYDI